MRAIDLIEKKQNGLELNYDEIKFMIDGYVKGSIPDYQMSAFLMAIYFKGMTDIETTNLALIMRDSGDIVDLSNINGIKVDKHSTGGVGDKVSFVVGPILAALGLKVAKMSGRGLGHTGGTIDKLESIPGFNTNISNDKFINEVNEIGLSIVGQSGNLAPADKKIYALRDVTSTVASIPLIASSIMSKKLASGADIICLDVKVGSGAFMKTLDDARKLATLMVNIGKNAGKKMVAILTSMQEPLGSFVGNSLEVIEAIDALKGNGSKDLYEVSYEIVSEELLQAGLYKTKDETYKEIDRVIKDGSAFLKFKDMVRFQGGDISYILDTKKFKVSKNIIEIKAKESGYIKEVDAYKVGHAAMILGAGREKLGDMIDYSAGIFLNKKVGDKVNIGEVIATLYTNKEYVEDGVNLVSEAYKYSKEKVKLDLILDIIK